MKAIIQNRLATTLLLATVVYTALWAAAQAETPSIPKTLAVSTPSRLIFKAAATGYQIYSCQASKETPNKFAWTLKAPVAKLYNDRGQSIGQHYAGPTWELPDGSKVVGKIDQKADAPSPDAIPWLLLKTTSTSKKGVLSNVEWIQRLNTVKGKAPTDGCDRDRQNTETRVGYQADYYFYSSK